MFLGYERVEGIRPVNDLYPGINSPMDLYKALMDGIWTLESCAPRLRPGWSETNKSLGQCSISAFLCQDIFGGEVYGTPAKSGTHCFNVVNGVMFDLASEQFGSGLADMNFDDRTLQSREAHFADEGKLARYQLLIDGLKARCR